MTQTMTLQTLTLPQAGVDADPRLYLLPHDGITVMDTDTGADRDRDTGTTLAFDPGGIAGFDAWANLLNLANWQAHCALDGLWLTLAGTGTLSVELLDFGTEQTLYRAVHTLDAQEVKIDLSPLSEPLLAASSLLAVRLVALGPATLTRGAFVTQDTHARPTRLATCITTYGREAAVTQTAARLQTFLAAQTGTALGATHVFVVDNGQSTDIPNSTHVTTIPNVNLGGAGGFARGLAAALDGGFTHCLFMDDDASFGMENLIRTQALLTLARDPRTALAGAMIAAERPWALWENGAVFDGVCRPQFGGTDLRDPGAILALESASTGPKPPGFYGGWWYFAFPLDGLKHHPFPFFVRGDDSSFSLANDFTFATLNGVVSFQDDFGAKETPLIHYLDLRYHLHHTLVHPDLGLGARRTGMMATRLILRQMMRMHYASAAAQLQAWRDVLDGPAFFEANADMATKRPQIAALSAPEAWTPSDSPPPTAIHHPAPWLAHLMRITLNGHLIPLFGLLARRTRLDLQHRAFLWPIWGARAVTIVDANAGRSYTVTHSKTKFLSLMGQLAVCLWRWHRGYGALRRDHRAGYARMTQPAWWRAVFAKGPHPLP